MEELGRIGADAYKAMAKKRIRVILDDVRSRHNVGAIFRTADAFALEGIVLCGFTPVPPHREIEKTALGATLSVPWSQATSATAAIQALRSEGFRIVAVEQTHGAIALADWQPSSGEAVALVFGNELNGVSDEAIALCDACIMIPQSGTKHSLNIAVCAGIVLWWAAGKLQ